MFGKDRRVALHLLDLPAMVDKLEGVRMELEDTACECARRDRSQGAHRVPVAFATARRAAPPLPRGPPAT